MPNRREFLATGAVLPATAVLAGGQDDPVARVAMDLDRYIRFGSKQAGGTGDNRCGAWLAAEIAALGFEVERQSISVPWFEPRASELRCGGPRTEVCPQPIVMPTGEGGVSGPLVRVDGAGMAEVPLSGAIALLELAFARHSSAMSKAIREPVHAAFAMGAKAVIVVTHGPSGKVIALNADGRQPIFAGPVALLAPEDAGPFLAAAMRAEVATLVMTGEGGRRPATNFIGRIDRGRKKWVVVSTPRSGWYDCAGERGGGVATWLWLARWASRVVTGYNLAFVCNSGHEYENLGAAEALKATAPRPADTHFWLHLGANLASQDWHDFTGAPLPGVDTQRYLSVTPGLLPLAREIFAGQPGLEAPYSSETVSAGEQVEILAAGYATVAAVFGTHRFHHVASDNARCVSAANVARTARAFQTLMERVAF
ncbi:hypothetical protein [Sphingomonas soli]|uniref:hypothetical protein n=1 Tax=Sphingomonas soli TaxID=266127 RepID=UPI0008321BB4|nr:hypothetical protein [Sphingomonas soli]